ncbi:MAG: poly-gamma-glutamate hydrolase family protein [Acidimicrobiales bacterium]
MPAGQTAGAPATLTELLAVPGVTEHHELRSRFGFMAFHGGNLERATDRIARAAADRAGASFYGVVQGPGVRHHLASTRFDPAESPALAAFVEHCDVVVAVHGYGRRGRWTEVLVGGRNRDLAADVVRPLRRRLPEYRFADRLDDIPKPLRGQHRDNPCNLTRGGGVQLELPPRLRGLTPMANHWPGADRAVEFSHLHRLVDGLAEAATRWELAQAGSGHADTVAQ